MPNDEYLIEICSDRFLGYRLKGINIEAYYARAIDRASRIYLNCYSKVYRKIFCGGFNILWVDKPNNSVDPRDGFWSLNYFYFNLSLIHAIAVENNVKVSLTCNFEPSLYRPLKQFCEDNKYKLIINQEVFTGRSANKNKRKFIKQLTEIKALIGNRNSCFAKDDGYLFNSRLMTVYLYIYPFAKDVNTYLEWRYKGLIEQLLDCNLNVILFSTEDVPIKTDLPVQFINVTNNVSVLIKMYILVKSLIINLKTRLMVFKEGRVRVKLIEYIYFLKRIPMFSYYGLLEQYCMSKFFNSYGLGIVLYAESLVYKKTAIINTAANKQKLRTMGLAGRVFSKNRLSNRLSCAHLENKDNVLPDAFFVNDNISYKCLLKEAGGQINIYKNKPLPDEPYTDNNKIKELRNIAVLLQRNLDNMEGMIEEVICATKDLSGLNIYLIAHPNFPVANQFVNSLGNDSNSVIVVCRGNIENTINNVDLCITAYSSAVLEYARRGCPVLWMTYVTINAIFNQELNNAIGSVIKNREELSREINKMYRDKMYYNSKSKAIIEEYKSVTSDAEIKGISLVEAVNRELAKIKQ